MREIFKSGSVRGSSNLGAITSKKGALWALLDTIWFYVSLLGMPKLIFTILFETDAGKPLMLV